MSVEVTQPIALAGLLLILLLAAAHRYSLVDFSRQQRLFSLTVRSCILTLIVLALAGLTLIFPSRQTKIILLADQSRSIDSHAAEIRNAFIEQYRNTIPDGRFAGVVHFGTKDSTNIAEAIPAALAAIPSDYVPHIVLLSDGNETQGDVLAALNQYKMQNRAMISTVPLPSSQASEVLVAGLDFPDIVRQGEPFYLDVTVQSNVETDAVITIYKGPFKLLEENKPLRIGENRFRFQQTAGNQRQEELTAAVKAEADTQTDNNRLTGVIVAEGNPRILMLDRVPATLRFLTAALREQEIEVIVRPPEGLPRTLQELAGFDAVLLSDVPADMMSADQMNLLKTYVSALGGGLLMFGSEHSFGLGGYDETPIEEILPVHCDYQKEQDKPSLAMCIVLDRSGSMGGEKIELAKDAAKAAVELLTPQDFASIVAFDNESYPVVPMQSTASTTVMLSAISTIESAGGTNIYPALTEAYEQLRRIPAKLKHVILLTDGYSTPGDFESIARQLARDSITVSTVGIGDADHRLLETIAEIGRGRHYVCDDPQSVPQIFAKETIAAKQSALREIPFVPVQISASAVIREIDIATAPPLLGYVATKPKPAVQFILATETGDPLLLWQRFGLGQTAAFCSDAKSRWGVRWIAWKDFGKFWTQIIRHILRPAQEQRTDLQIETGPEGLHITLDAVDEHNRYINGAEGTIKLIPSAVQSTEPSDWNLCQTAPGRYEAVIPLEHAKGSAFQVQSELKLGEEILSSQFRSVLIPLPLEQGILPVNEALLRRLAELTGGRYHASAEEIRSHPASFSVKRAYPLWSWLLTLAAVLYTFDVLLRRIEIL